MKKVYKGNKHRQASELYHAVLGIETPTNTNCIHIDKDGTYTKIYNSRECYIISIKEKSLQSGSKNMGYFDDLPVTIITSKDYISVLYSNIKNVIYKFTADESESNFFYELDASLGFLKMFRKGETITTPPMVIVSLQNYVSIESSGFNKIQPCVDDIDTTNGTVPIVIQHDKSGTSKYTYKKSYLPKRNFSAIEVIHDGYVSIDISNKSREILIAGHKRTHPAKLEIKGKCIRIVIAGSENESYIRSRLIHEGCEWRLEFSGFRGQDLLIQNLSFSFDRDESHKRYITNALNRLDLLTMGFIENNINSQIVRYKIHDYDKNAPEWLYCYAVFDNGPDVTLCYHIGKSGDGYIHEITVPKGTIGIDSVVWEVAVKALINQSVC